MRKNWFLLFILILGISSLRHSKPDLNLVWESDFTQNQTPKDSQLLTNKALLFDAGILSSPQINPPANSTESPIWAYFAQHSTKLQVHQQAFKIYLLSQAYLPSFSNKLYLLHRVLRI